jgi:hypothetical protein
MKLIAPFKNASNFFLTAFYVSFNFVAEALSFVGLLAIFEFDVFFVGIQIVVEISEVFAKSIFIDHNC